MDIRLEPLAPGHFAGLHRVFDRVCRERRWLLFTEGGTLESASAYYRSVLDGGHIHRVALRGDEVLGWCDILGQAPETRRHVGLLGMALAPEARGQGLGRALIGAALAEADARGLRRVELSVHADNRAAQALYRRVGFETEGVLRGAWCLDGREADMLTMARRAAPGAGDAAVDSAAGGGR